MVSWRDFRGGSRAWEQKRPFMHVLLKIYPLPVKILRYLTLVIARLRPYVSRNSASDDSIRPLDKNWPQAFYRRHYARCYRWRLARFWRF